MFVLKLFVIQISLYSVLIVYFNYIFLYFEQNKVKQYMYILIILRLFERKANFALSYVIE